MLEIFKDTLKKCAIFTGSVSFGILFYKFGILFSKIQIFFYFLIILGICTFVYKSLKFGFENAIIDVIFLSAIYIVRMDFGLKTFIYGAFIFVSISSVFNRIRDTGRGRGPVTGVLYLLIMIIIVILFLRGNIVWVDIQSSASITNNMWLLFGLISLIGSI